MGALIDTGEQDRMLGGEPSLLHHLKGRKLQEQRTVHQIYDNNGILHTSFSEILLMITEYIYCKYDHITLDDECVRHINDCGLQTISPAAKEVLEEPITMDELLQTIKKAK
jgi:hypothetical protein